MKARSIVFSILLLILSSFQISEVKLLLFINDKAKVIEGQYINCLTISNLTVIMSIDPQMKSYDVFKLELHRFGSDIDIIAASKTFDPNSKDFQKKYESKGFAKLKVLAEETNFRNSDLEANTNIFPRESTVNSIFCKSHDLKHCSFYLIVKGYKKTGEKNEFGEDLFDQGTDLSSKSIVFKSWEDKTIRKSK